MPELAKTILADSSNLKAYYKFNSGALTTDSSGNGYTLSNNNTVGETASGKFGYAADLGSSSNKYFSIANDIGITGGAITMSCWVKLNAEVSANKYDFFNQGDASTFVDYHITYEYNSGTRRLVFRRIRRGVVANDVNYNLTLGTSSWYHLVLTYDGTTLRAFVNGAYVGGIASSGNGSSGTSDITGIGADVSSGPPDANTYAFTLIDDAAIFSSALSADQIKELYEGHIYGELRPNQFGTTVALYHFEGNANDSSGNSNYGTSTSITYSLANGKLGQGAGFNGTTSKIVVADAASIQDIFAAGGTFMAWINPTTTGGGGFGRIAEKDETGNDGWLLYVTDSSGGFCKLEFQKRFSTTNGLWTTSTRPIELTKWHHVVVTYSSAATTNDPIFYVNGAPVAISETTTPVGSASSDASNPLVIGNRNSDNARGMNGAMDEMYTTKTILTANQIRQIYAYQKGLLGRYA